uniref:Uncharacterized protein n=1 Tax=Anopheles melas TaxID=34690 RepID=A0A182U157_9DIPT
MWKDSGHRDSPSRSIPYSGECFVNESESEPTDSEPAPSESEIPGAGCRREDMRTRLASLIVVKQEPLSATSPPPPTPHASAHPLSGASFSSPSSSSSSSSSCSSASSSSSPPSSLFRSSLVVADGCDGLHCYGSFGPAASAVELKHPGQPRVADGVVVVVQQQQSAPHADLVAQYFCDRNGHGYGAHANGSGGDLNNNDPSSEQFEFFDEKKS